jgi:hypothetical protein
MKVCKSSFIALLCLAASTNLIQLHAQSQQTMLVTPQTLLGLGVHKTVAKSSASRSIPDPVAMGLAKARVYRFASADFPGTSTSLVFDRNNSTILGDVSAATSFGFTLQGAQYQAFSVPGSGSGGNVATAINTAGTIVGLYVDITNVTHGFVDNTGTFTTLNIGSGGIIEPIDINDAGEIVGGYIDTSNVTHGFSTVDNGASYHIFDVPGATSTTAAGVNSSGMISGVWVDSSSKSHGFLYDGVSTFTSFDFPLATSTTGIGINDSNEVAGAYTDAANVTHGFIYSAGAFTEVDVAGASGTQLTRIKNNGQITGSYTDSLTEQHGLTGH